MCYARVKVQMLEYDDGVSQDEAPISESLGGCLRAEHLKQTPL
jgi:hypothetical protein